MALLPTLRNLNIAYYVLSEHVSKILHGKILGRFNSHLPIGEKGSEIQERKKILNTSFNL